jgi:WD40 repeat protein
VNLAEIVSDGRRFVLKFRSIIEIAPLQLYRSALLYCPELSIIRQTYKHLVPKWIISSPTVERRWSPLLQTLEDQQALYDVAFSPDGKIVASSSVCLYDAATGTLLKTLDALSEDSNRSEGSAVAFSRDGKRVISISWQGALRVWDVSSGLIISEVKSAVVGATAFWRIFSRDRTLAVALLNSNTVEVIDIANGRILKTFQPHGENAVDSLALSQDGQHLASASKNGAIQLWNTVTAAPRHELKRPFEDMLLGTRLAFSPDGKWLAALSKRYAISLWNPANGELMGEIPGWFYDACFLPDSNVLVTSCETKDGDSGLVKLWDVSSRKLLKAMPANCLGLQLSPDGRYLTSAPLRHGAYDSQGGGRRINVWDITTGMINKVFHSPSDDLSCLTFSNDNKLLASASDFNGTIQLWDLVTHSQFLHDSQQDGIDSFKLSPNRKIAASITIPYSKVRLWDMETGALRGEVSGGVSSFSPDGKWFVTSNGKTDDIYNVATMELVHSAEKLDPKGPGRFAFSPDSKFLAQDFSDPVSHMAEDRANEIYANIPADQPIVRIWDAETWKLLFTFEARYNRITAMKFSPDSTLLAGAVFCHLDRPRAKETSFIIWDVLNGCRQRIVTVPVIISECLTADLAWSPDGTTVALLTTDRKVRLCHVASGHVKSLDLQERGISVAFSSDGLLLAAGSRIQGSIELWDVHTGTRIGIRKALGFRRWLQFSDDCQSIETDHGRFGVDAFYPGQELARKRDFLIENDWVVYGGKRILLLPIDYRATCAVAVSDLLLMGHASGRVTSLRIDATSFGSI